ncbi:MAG: RDD family protein [Elusimicrobia bacterium]|nr:RDD family protein [Elusimicrobiota bacterium]
MAENSPPLGFAAVPPRSAELELAPAKVSDRFVAFLLDLAPFLGGYIATMLYIQHRVRSGPLLPDDFVAPGALWAALTLAYQFVGNLTGGTAGKRLMSIKAVRLDGSPLGFVRSLLRAVGWFLSMPLCNLGFLIAFVHPQSRTLHDLLSGALVVESRAKNPAEAFILFLAAACAVCALFFGNVYYNLHYKPFPSDLLAVEKARAGLRIMAQIEEAYKARNGSYTRSLQDLVDASGDPKEFTKAMAEIFDPHLFRLEASLGRYRISGVAKDRARTRVSIDGPLSEPAR